jgi:hypothetical protein
MSGTTNLPTVVTPSMNRSRAVAQLRDAFRRLWSHTKRPQRDGAVTSIAKGILTSERFKGLDHVVAVQFDAIERETPIEVVEEFWQLGATIMRSKHAIVSGDDPLKGATLGELLGTERQTHAEREYALALFLDNKTYQNAQRLFEAACVHEQADRRLMEFTRRKAAECDGSKLAMSRGSGR